MSIGLIGTKLGMTREFMESGQSVPVTVIKVEKGRVLDVISKEKRGYSAVKVGFFKQKTAYEISLGLVGSEMCIRDRSNFINASTVCGVGSIMSINLL